MDFLLLLQDSHPPAGPPPIGHSGEPSWASDLGRVFLLCSPVTSPPFSVLQQAQCLLPVWDVFLLEPQLLDSRAVVFSWFRVRCRAPC